MRSNDPVVRVHDGIHVVRDDFFPGGTKARYLQILFGDAQEIVYASPCEGAAQTALAITAARMKRKATIFLAKRQSPHPRALMAKKHGAAIYQVTPGYLTVVSKRAREYAEMTPGAVLAPFGVDMPATIETIAEAARATGLRPDEVWCAAGSGTLARGLAKAWPLARRHVVQVGKKLGPEDVAGAMIHVAREPFERASKADVPFPSDPHYDAKAWEICKARRGAGLVLFWNVTGPANPNG